ncbi:MAG TPA: hypothetical protein VIK24_03180, partial [Pyrinomonadaceae bacterium]
LAKGSNRKTGRRGDGESGRRGDSVTILTTDHTDSDQRIPVSPRHPVSHSPVFFLSSGRINHLDSIDAHRFQST